MTTSKTGGPHDPNGHGPGIAGYRADIDGLRALAVLSVIGFHAFPAWVPGGFAGVDVFFVISGFLIGGIIWSQLADGSFSFGTFYARRVLRILPALALVLAVCLLAGWLLLLPSEFVQLGRHVAAGAAFVSNFALWSEAGYFDRAAEFKPLLHLWSLGIEEQFYIVWPLLATLLWRRRWPFLGVVSALALASFLLNVALVGQHPVAAFYSPLSRVWELAAGAVLAYLAAHGPALRPGNADWRAGAGLALVVASVLLLDQRMAFPGWWALAPVGGAWLLISAPEAWLNRRLLARPGLVWVGLISYPLYLWHWPILAFTRILNGDATGWQLRGAAVLLAFVLAWLTYRFVERPLRSGGFGRARICAALCACVAAVACAGVAVSFYPESTLEKFARGDAASAGLSPEALAKYRGFQKEGPRHPMLPCPAGLTSKTWPLNFCYRSSEQEATFALFGDSQADDKFAGIAEQDRAHSWVLAASNSCVPLNGVRLSAGTADCEERSEMITRWLLTQPQIRTVVLSFWGNYILPMYAADHLIAVHPPKVTISAPPGTKATAASPVELMQLGLENTVDLLERNGKSVVLLLDVPELPFFPYDCVRRSAAFRCKLGRAEVMARQAMLRGIVQRMQAKHPALRVYDPMDWFCKEAECQMPDDTMAFYRDSNHLSTFGSDYYASKFLPWLHGG